MYLSLLLTSIARDLCRCCTTCVSLFRRCASMSTSPVIVQQYCVWCAKITPHKLVGPLIVSDVPVDNPRTVPHCSVCGKIWTISPIQYSWSNRK